MSYIDDLKVHVSSDPRAADDKEKIKTEEDEKSRRIKNLLPVVIPAIIAVILILATIPSFFAKRNAYSDAKKLMDMGRYDEAKAAFEALGDYSDSRGMAKYAVEYSRAVSVAMEGDELMATNGAMAVENYEQAIEMFSSLEGFSDSDDQIKAIEEKIAVYDEEVRKSAYEEAEALLKEEKYASAKEAFESLGNYKDSKTMAKKCIYDRAMKLVDYIKENEIRNVYANPTYDGEDYTIEETKYPVLDMRPIYEVASEELLTIKDYEDSEELAAYCTEKGNFKKEFLDLCAEGKTAEAIEWLNTYDDEFDEREPYANALASFGRYCTAWELYRGDSTLLPLSGGCSEKCADITCAFAIKDSVCMLTISGVDVSFAVTMQLSENGNGFIYSPGDSTNYYAVINTQNHLTYTRYNADGKTMSSCEYSLPE